MFEQLGEHLYISALTIAFTHTGGPSAAVVEVARATQKRRRHDGGVHKQVFVKVLVLVKVVDNKK